MAGEGTIQLKIKIDPASYGFTQDQLDKLLQAELVIKPPKDGPKGYLTSLREEIAKLRKEQENALDPEGVKRYTQQIDVLEGKVKDLTTVQKEVAQVDPFAGMSDLLPSVTAIGAATVGIGAFTAAIASGVKGLVELDEATSFIGTLGVQNFQRFKQEAIDISSRIGTESAAGIANEIYNAISGGISEAGAAQFVELSAKAAVAGRATTAEASNLGSSLLNAYKKDASEAGQVFDEVFQVINLGKLTLTEFNAAGANIIPIASAAGVPLKQWGAALATMTKQGVPAVQASTRVAQAMIEIQKPGKELEAIMKKAGIESGTYALKNLGLQGTLDKIGQAAKANNLELVQVFSSSEAAAAAMGLAGDNAKGAAADLASMAGAAGSTDKAFGVMSQSLGVQIQTIQTRFQNFLIEQAQKLEPVLTAVLGAAAPLMDLFEEFGPVLFELAGVIAALIAGWVAYKGAVEGAKLAQNALATLLEKNPYAIAIAAAAALVIAIREVADALQYTAEEKQKDLEAEAQWLTKQREGLVTQREQVKTTKDLADQYITLAEKSGRTKEENDKLKKIGDDLNRQYPGLIDNTKAYGESLDSVRKFAQDAANKIGDYNRKITQLDKDIAKNQVKQMENLVTVAIAKMNKTVAEETGTLINKASNAVFGFDTARENAQKFSKSYADALFDANDEEAVRRAFNEFNNKIGRAVKAEDFDNVVAQLYYAGAEDAAAKRIEYITKRLDILSLKAQDTNKELNGGDPPPPPPPPPKMLGYIPKLEEEIKKLREQYDKLSEAEHNAGKGVELVNKIDKINEKIADLKETEQVATVKSWKEITDKAIEDGEKATSDYIDGIVEAFEKEGIKPPEIDDKELTDKQKKTNQFLEQFNLERKDLSEKALAILDNMTEKEKKALKEAVDFSNDIGKAFGTAFAQAVYSGEPVLKQALKAMLMVVLDYLEKLSLAAALGVTLEEILTKGPFGFASGAIYAALITAAFETAKGAITAFATGGVIVGENGPEVIAPAKEFSEFAGTIVAAAVAGIQAAVNTLRSSEAESRRIDVSSSFTLVPGEMRWEHDAIYQSVELVQTRKRYQQLGGH